MGEKNIPKNWLKPQIYKIYARYLRQQNDPGVPPFFGKHSLFHHFPGDPHDRHEVTRTTLAVERWRQWAAQILRKKTTLLIVVVIE